MVVGEVRASLIVALRLTMNDSALQDMKGVPCNEGRANERVNKWRWIGR